jgi:peptide chain release factor subunit 3
MGVNEEEKNQDKTVEISRAVFNTNHKRYTILDGQGHKNYVVNMTIKNSLPDYGALVISAKRGDFESCFDLDGQSREHV